MICKNCGQELTPGMKFCTGCGTPVENQEPVAVETPVEETVTTEPEQAPVNNIENPEPVQPQTGFTPVQNPGTPVQPMGSQGAPVPPVPPVFNGPNQYYNAAPQNNASFNNATRPVYSATAAPQENTEPLSAWAYVGLMLLFSCTCCVGWIFMFVFAFSKEGNVNRKKFAQGYLILWIAGVIIGILFSILYGAIIVAAIKNGTVPQFDPSQFGLPQSISLFKSLF